MDVIETDKQFEDFLSHYRKENEVFVDAVPANQKVHRKRSGVSFVLVRTAKKEALFPVQHNDATTLNPKKLLKLNTDALKFTFDKKKVLQLIPFHNLVDCTLLYWFRHNRPPNFESFGKIYPDVKNIYKPLMSLAERSQYRIDQCEKILRKNRDVVSKKPFQKYNEKILETLFRVERNGMYANSDTFTEIFGKDLTDDKNLSYSNYNLYTQTGRPSNAFKGVNYAALDKDQRFAFESRFDGGKLLSVDYDAFHLRIVSALTGYNAPKGSFHEHLGKLYFGEENLSEEEYKEAKKFTFQFLYNPKGIPDELLQLDFFSSVKDLTERIWDIYEEHGVISTPKYGRQITGSKINNFNPAKALNYILQAGGLEIICGRLSKLMDYLSDKDTCAVLYLYDSVLLDYNPEDGAELSKIKSIMETGDLTVDLEIGDRFSNLEEIHMDESVSKKQKR